jgi:hypothetical protein
MYLFRPRKGAVVPDLNALVLCLTWGFSGRFQIKSLFLGQNKYMYGRFGGHMDTMNTSAQSKGLRMRLNVSTRIPAEVTAFLWPLDQLFLKLKLKLMMMSDDIFFE